MAKISIAIDVPSLGLAVDFYTGALGCEKVRDQAPNMSVLSADGVELYLLEKEASATPIPGDSGGRSYERHWTPVHLDFASSDVPAAVARVLESGGAHEGGEKGEWGEIAYCADPFGNGFCLIRE